VDPLASRRRLRRRARAATLAARAELWRIPDALRSLCGVWRRLNMVATADQIGVREGRRIHGRYMVTADDLIEGHRHHDAVTTVRFPVDVHATRPNTGGGYDDENASAKPYDIPLRALITGSVDGLLLAGRCISSDFIAQAS
jgi:UDP-2,3-diacylglucosamine pyrophosphatase LpxH